MPAGAAISTLEGEIISRAHNRVISLQDPSAHAEILAIRKASAVLGNFRLPGLVLISTLEPCAMCLSCALQSRLRGVVYGAEEPKWGAHKSIASLNSLPLLNHRLEFIESGILADESRRLMQTFFRGRRQSRINSGAV